MAQPGTSLQGRRDKIDVMLYRSNLRSFAFVVSLVLTAGALALRAQDDNNHHGRKYKPPPLSARIEVTVLRDYNGKPIHGAHVIFHPIEGDKDKGSLELKTMKTAKRLSK